VIIALHRTYCVFGPISSHTRGNRNKKEALLKKIEEVEAIQQFEFRRPTSISHPFLRKYANVVDHNVAVSLKNYFTELIKCCCLYESKRETCRGSAKAQKLSLALDSFKKSAREAQAVLNEHLDERFGTVYRMKGINSHIVNTYSIDLAVDAAARALYATGTIDREIADQKMDVDQYLQNTTEMINFHLYNRNLEEMEMLVVSFCVCKTFFAS